MLDLSGKFVFALRGALAAARRRLDLLDVLVPTFAATTPGGIVCNVLFEEL